MEEEKGKEKRKEENEDETGCYGEVVGGEGEVTEENEE